MRLPRKEESMTSIGIQYLQYLEDVRRNKANEHLESVKIQETQRSNLARENETNRHNLASERLSARSLDETIRSNIVREAETNRANLARETETNRANLAQEAQKARDTNMKYSPDVVRRQEALSSLDGGNWDSGVNRTISIFGSALDSLAPFAKLLLK